MSWLKILLAILTAAPEEIDMLLQAIAHAKGPQTLTAAANTVTAAQKAQATPATPTKS